MVGNKLKEEVEKAIKQDRFFGLIVYVNEEGKGKMFSEGTFGIDEMIGILERKKLQILTEGNTKETGVQ